MDARAVWKQFAQSDEGRALAAQLEEAEDDQLTKQAELDHKISRALQRLAERMDTKELVASKKCDAETLYRSRHFSDHCELTMKLPDEMVLELGSMLTHYEDHNCAPAAAALDAFTKTIIVLMLDSLPAELVEEHLSEEDDEDDD